MGKKKSKEKITKSAKPAEPTEKPTETPAVKPAEKKPSEVLAERVLSEMKRLAANGITEFTSTLLRDKLGLDKESGRDQIRRAMKQLEKDGKVVVGKKEGKRKQYTYKLVE